MAKIDKGNGTTFFIISKGDLGKDNIAYGSVLNNQVMDTYVEKTKIKEYKKAAQYISALEKEGVFLDDEEKAYLISIED